MDANFRIWLIVVSLALISSVMVQIVRLLAMVRPVTGSGPGLREIFDKAFQAATAVDRAARAAGDILEQISRQVHHSANVSVKRLAYADRVALSAGLRIGETDLFRRSLQSTEGRQE
jgi:hypothetical protein